MDVLVQFREKSMLEFFFLVERTAPETEKSNADISLKFSELSWQVFSHEVVNGKSIA